MSVECMFTRQKGFSVQVFGLRSGLERKVRTPGHFLASFRGTG